MGQIEWHDSPSMPGVRRGRLLRPAFDCGPEGRDCKHPKKGDHGQHCDDWIYVIAAPGFAVSLEVFSGNYPRGGVEPPWGASLDIHSARQIYEWADKPTRQHCIFIEAACWSDGTSLGAREFYEAHGHGTFDETEGFWLALEFEFEKRRPPPLRGHPMTAQERIARALQLIERAQNDLNAACAELSPVRGLVPEWERVGKLADQVKAQWHRLNGRAPPRGGWRLDSEPPPEVSP